ncbi:ATP-binding SpoIIE family protein phosphatase [Nonomuraea sp. C10]|uniref:ATP-binding SpoIIE family protein phosphatase n=1 Tax=Nonomuraea sp. C10 TaxID=2600577 RepID=UPI0011CD90C8|nr:ATP-binding SpoIIE family protein phosphatase [Nonomuraea sp. C10]TXK40539.1 SpoIIE family protein phosphatase [Nonomuraea sp. C10]
MIEADQVRDDAWIRAEEPSSVGAVRRLAIDLAKTAGFGDERVGQVAVAVTEAVSNLVKHAVQGVALVRPCPGAPEVVELITLDRGPGMPDVARALRDGYSTSGTLGIGLGAITRMASSYDVHSLPGRGTLLAVQFAAKGTIEPPPASGFVRPIGEEVISGDAFAVSSGEQALTVLVFDGLGHGPAAAHASRKAVELFLEGPDDEPLAILRRLHDGLAHTRGGAAAVARVTSARVSYAGLGNISGWIAHADDRQGMVSVPGITGHQRRRLRQYEYDLDEHATVVLHSDGLTDRWSPATMPGLFSRSPAVIAAGLLREAGSRRDDACVVIVRPRRDRA